MGKKTTLEKILKRMVKMERKMYEDPEKHAGVKRQKSNRSKPIQELYVKDLPKGCATTSRIMDAFNEAHGETYETRNDFCRDVYTHKPGWYLDNSDDNY